MSYLISTQDFLDSLVEDGQYYQVTDRKTIAPLSERANRIPDLYCVGGMKTKRGSGVGGRCNKQDIDGKKYFYLDYDIRSLHQDITGDVLSEEDLFSLLETIIEEFQGKYKNRKYIVYSGNGFHFYYLIDPRYGDPDVYKKVVKEICRQAPKREYLDTSVCYVSALSRLPGSINSKVESKYGLDPIRCKVVRIGKDNSGFDFNLIAKIIDEKEKKAIKEIKKKQKKYVGSSTGDTFEKIQEIPCYLLVEKYKGLTIARDGRNFKAQVGPRKGQNMGLFYVEESNLVINQGTTHLSGGLNGYNPYTFMKYEVLNNGSFKEIVERLTADGFIN